MRKNAAADDAGEAGAEKTVRRRMPLSAFLMIAAAYASIVLSVFIDLNGCILGLDERLSAFVIYTNAAVGIIAALEVLYDRVAGWRAAALLTLGIQCILFAPIFLC